MGLWRAASFRATVDLLVAKIMGVAGHGGAPDLGPAETDGLEHAVVACAWLPAFGEEAARAGR